MTDRELFEWLLWVTESAEHFQGKQEMSQALRERLAQPEPEPVFYVIQATDRFGEGYEQTYWEDPNGFPVYAAPVHAIDIPKERVDETAKSEHDIVGACVTCGAPHGFWLSAPPTDFISPSVVKAISKREWVGLTDEEIYDYADKFLYQHGSNYGIKSFGKAIEAKLKEKNT